MNISIDKLVSDVVDSIKNDPFVKIGVSNRHIHLTKNDVETLFGKNYSLTPLNYLQPGQFSCKETVHLISEKGTIENVRIIGPERPDTQVEISVTDSFKLGVKPPLRNSGDISGASKITILSPVNGEKIEKNAVIIALRHIHMPLDFASKYGFYDKQYVSVKTFGPRNVIFDNVCIRVSEKFDLEMHIDTDEANCAYIKNGDFCKILQL